METPLAYQLILTGYPIYQSIQSAIYPIYMSRVEWGLICDEEDDKEFYSHPPFDVSQPVAAPKPKESWAQIAATSAPVTAVQAPIAAAHTAVPHTEFSALIFHGQYVHRIFLRELSHGQSTSQWAEPQFANSLLQTSSGQQIQICSKHPTYVKYGPKFMTWFTGFLNEQKGMLNSGWTYTVGKVSKYPTWLFPSKGQQLHFPGKILYCLDDNMSVCDLPIKISSEYTV